VLWLRGHIVRDNPKVTGGGTNDKVLMWLPIQSRAEQRCWMWFCRPTATLPVDAEAKTNNGSIAALTIDVRSFQWLLLERLNQRRSHGRHRRHKSRLHIIETAKTKRAKSRLCGPSPEIAQRERVCKKVDEERGMTTHTDYVGLLTKKGAPNETSAASPRRRTVSEAAMCFRTLALASTVAFPIFSCSQAG